MNPITEKLYEAWVWWGGLTKLAEAIGVNAATVYCWQTRGNIPRKYWETILNNSRGAIKLSDLEQMEKHFFKHGLNKTKKK
jgi:hypothetical protein